jgi:uncharacterized membrane protein
VFIFGAAALLVLREWQTASQEKFANSALGEAERRLVESHSRRQRGWTIAAATASLAVILVLTADFVYTRANSAPPASRVIVAAGGEARVPISEVEDGGLHIFTVATGGETVRFMIIKKPNGYGTALDACRICGAEGYRQDGQNVICRHCASAIYVPSIGDQGGCNPIGVPARVEGGEIVIEVSALAHAAKEIPN